LGPEGTLPSARMCGKADYAMKVKRSHGATLRRSCAQAVLGVLAINAWNILVMGLAGLGTVWKNEDAILTALRGAGKRYCKRTHWAKKKRPEAL
jgi:hypothetical protein